MFSSNVKKFSIRHLMIGTALFSFCIGSLLSGHYFLTACGSTLLILLAGLTLAYCMFFISDSLDKGPIDTRRLRSRFWNFFGLVFTIATLLVFIAGSVATFFTFLYWFLNDVLSL